MGGGGGEGRGEEYTTTRKVLKRSTLIKDTDPLFRDLEDNQIEELPPGVFENNTELAVLYIYAYVDINAQLFTHC